VRHRIVIHHSGVNVFVRALVWLIMKTGKPQGEPFLERFRRIVEDESLVAAGSSS
jgi:hypothetical protein